MRCLPGRDLRRWDGLHAVPGGDFIYAGIRGLLSVCCRDVPGCQWAGIMHSLPE